MKFHLYQITIGCIHWKLHLIAADRFGQKLDLLTSGFILAALVDVDVLDGAYTLVGWHNDCKVF